MTIQDLKEKILDLIQDQHPSSFRSLLKRNPEVFQELITTTAHHHPRNISESVWIAINGEPPRCTQNQKRKFNTWYLGYRIGCELGNKCKCIADIRMSKQQATMEAKYGVSKVSHIPGVTEKRKSTNLQKWGVAAPAQCPEISQKMVQSKKTQSPEKKQQLRELAQARALKKWGKTHHMQTTECLEKQQATTRKNWGVNSPLQNPKLLQRCLDTKQQFSPEQQHAIKQKTQATLQAKYGVTAASLIPLTLEAREVLSSQEKFTEAAAQLTRKEFADFYQIHPHTVYLHSKQHQAKFKKPPQSEFEISVVDFLKSLTTQEIQIGNREILSGQEIDIFLPESKLAIECSGLYWHSELASGRSRNYHFNKWKTCHSQGIQLITIWENVWKTRQIAAQNRLMHLLKLNKPQVSARQCEIHLITNTQASEFLNTFHIQSHYPSTQNWALMRGDQIHALMSWSPARYNNAAEWELTRFATRGHVPGAASKLFKNFISTNSPKTLVSYCDHAWGTGKLYEMLGFTHHNTQVGYWYTDYVEMTHRQKFTKKSLVNTYPELLEKSEWEIMQSLGWDRIWDCGQSTWLWTHK